MKKLLWLTVLLLLLVSVVSCSGEPAATTEGQTESLVCAHCNEKNPSSNNYCGKCGSSLLPSDTTTAPISQGTTTTPVITAVAATTPAITTPAATTPATTTPVTTTPETKPRIPKVGIDILWGPEAYRTVQNHYRVYDAFFESCVTFEMEQDDFGKNLFLSFYVMNQNSDIFMDIFYQLSYGAWEPCDYYRWVLTIDGEEVTVASVTLRNDKVRMAIEDWWFSDEVDAYGFHPYDINLKLYHKDSDDCAYRIYFTDPAFFGKYRYREIKDNERDAVDILSAQYTGLVDGDQIITVEPFAEFDQRMAFGMKMIGSIEEKLLPETTDANGNNVRVIDDNYKWVLIIGDQAIEVKNFYLQPQLGNSWVYLDIGNEWLSQEVDEEGYHAYEIRLDIYDKATGKLAYFAWFSDPLWWGKVYVKTPDFAK